MEDIRQIARHAVGKLSEDSDVVGAFLFGSAVSGCLDEGSDIDICLVYDRSDIRRSRELKELGGARLDICRYPVEKFARVFEDKGVRGKSDTWFDVSLWLGMMRGCEIIDDQHGMLRRWREAARKWGWRDDEIKPLERIYLKNLAAANLFIQEKKAFEATTFLREASTAAVCIKLMREDLIPFWDPRFLYRSLTSSQKFETLAHVFRSINELDYIDASRLRSFLKRLTFFVRNDGETSIGVNTQFHNSQDAYWRHQYPMSLLSARFTAFLLAPIILAKRHVMLPPLGDRLLDGSQHVDMILRLERTVEGFHGFYLDLLFLNRYYLKSLHQTLNNLCDLNDRDKL